MTSAPSHEAVRVERGGDRPTGGLGATTRLPRYGGGLKPKSGRIENRPRNVYATWLASANPQKRVPLASTSRHSVFRERTMKHGEAIECRYSPGLRKKKRPYGFSWSTMNRTLSTCSG